MHDHDKLWVQLLMAKYILNGDILSHQPPQSASFTWRSIMKAVSMLREGFKFRIGEGELSFWFDKWMDEGQLFSKVNYVHISDSHLKVKDILVDGVWILRDLYTLIPEDIKHNLNNLVIEREEGVVDCLIWGPSISGAYDAKSGYMWLLSQQRGLADDSGNWRWIWKLPTYEKCKFLVWLVCQDSLPTDKMRSSRGIGVQSSCMRCHAGDETSLHFLRDCSPTARIWHILGFVNTPNFFQNDAMNWICENAAKDNAILFLATLWFRWVRRNKAVIDNNLVTNSSLVLDSSNGRGFQIFLFSSLHAER